MTKVLSASALTIGIIEGVAESTTLIIKVFSGIVSDYLGKRKTVVLIGYSLSTVTKLIFAITSSIFMIFSARFIDRIGKGIRGAPRDALIADLSPPAIRGASFGLRQSLDTVGAFIGPVFAMVLLYLTANNFRFIFLCAFLPAVIAVLLLVFGVQEKEKKGFKGERKILWNDIKRLPFSYWWVVILGGIFTLSRFSEAFLVLKASEAGMTLYLIPLTLGVMSFFYALTAYPFGRLADHISHTFLLVLGIFFLIVSNLFLAVSQTWIGIYVGVSLWGIHMGITQGLFALMVSQTIPENLRGTGYGIFSLVSGLGMLVASILAGIIWDTLGSQYTFYCGIMLSTLTLIVFLFPKKKLLPFPKNDKYT